jgi:hypothetical protein
MAQDSADSRNLQPVGRAPAAAPAVRVFDVLLVTTNGGGSFDDFVGHPPVGDSPFELGLDLTIASLDVDLVELVMNACSQRAHYFVAARQYGSRHAFVLDHDVSEAERFR